MGESAIISPNCQRSIVRAGHGGGGGHSGLDLTRTFFPQHNTSYSQQSTSIDRRAFGYIITQPVVADETTKIQTTFPPSSLLLSSTSPSRPPVDDKRQDMTRVRLHSSGLLYVYNGACPSKYRNETQKTEQEPGGCVVCSHATTAVTLVRHTGRPFFRSCLLGCPLVVVLGAKNDRSVDLPVVHSGLMRNRKRLNGGA